MYVFQLLVCQNQSFAMEAISLHALVTLANRNNVFVCGLLHIYFHNKFDDTPHIFHLLVN